ncbi:MAG: hypothetical protein MUF80_04830 [Burkholderiales bacterium]|nr:hypothetical protein [Burkholderiales bacterium]
MTDISQALEIIKRGCEDLLVEEELVQKLRGGRPLRVLAEGRRLIYQRPEPTPGCVGDLC